MLAHAAALCEFDAGGAGDAGVSQAHRLVHAGLHARGSRARSPDAGRDARAAAGARGGDRSRDEPFPRAVAAGGPRQGLAAVGREPCRTVTSTTSTTRPRRISRTRTRAAERWLAASLKWPPLNGRRGRRVRAAPAVVQPGLRLRPAAAAAEAEQAEQGQRGDGARRRAVSVAAAAVVVEHGRRCRSVGLDWRCRSRVAVCDSVAVWLLRAELDGGRRCRIAEAVMLSESVFELLGRLGIRDARLGVAVGDRHAGRGVGRCYRWRTRRSRSRSVTRSSRCRSPSWTSSRSRSRSRPRCRSSRPWCRSCCWRRR
jgi:hypothetical protein